MGGGMDLVKERDLFIIGGEAGGFPDEFLFKRWVDADIQDTPRKGIDDFPLDFPPDRAVMEESKKMGLFNGFRLGFNPTPENLKGCEPGKYYFVMDLFRATLDYQRPGVKEKFKSYEKFLEDYYDRIFEVIKAHPDKAWGCAVGEMDSCCPWPRNAFRNKKEAFRFWKDTFFRHRVGSNDPAGLFTYLRKRGIDYRKANIMVHGAMLFGLHHYFDWGFQFVWLERGCGLSNLQLGVAFLRGAARQYGGRLWGLDFSTHHPQRNQCTWYDQEGRRRGGWSESLMLRSWMVGFLSGANFVHEEGSNYTHWVFDEKGRFRLSLAGRYAKKFADFALRRHPERGRTYTPVAILLNYYHGFDARHGVSLRQPMVWGGKMPYTSADANISNTLELFFPGHNQSWGMFDQVINPSVPWKSQWEYLEMLRKGYDMRPYEAGHLVRSPFGDCLDVLVDTADLKTLQKYPLLFLAGEQELSGVKGKRVLNYLKGGGTLIASVNQLPEEVKSVIGVKKTGVAWDYDLTTYLKTGEKFGGLRYGYEKLDVKKGKILGVNHKDHPLVWEIPYGKGKLILTGVPYSQDVSGSSLLPLFKRIFGEYIKEHLLALAQPDTLQLIVNQGKGFLLIGAFNNYHESWSGRITVREPMGVPEIGSGYPSKIKDIWSEREVKTRKEKGEVSFNDRIAPFEFKVYRAEFTR